MGFASGNEPGNNFPWVASFKIDRAVGDNDNVMN